MYLNHNVLQTPLRSLDLLLSLLHLLIVLLLLRRRLNFLKRSLLEPPRELEEERRSVFAVRLVEGDEVADERADEDTGGVIGGGDGL
jgi:hypothetical protein